VLVGDDGILLEESAERLVARPHPETRGLLEIRNLGIVRMPVCEDVAIALAIRLDKDAPRFVEAAPGYELAGIKLPLIRLWPDSPVLHLKAEAALAHFGLAHE
jgi:serine kinase of HPr protein (carbohydrate metabolism regulator)